MATEQVEKEGDLNCRFYAFCAFRTMGMECFECELPKAARLNPNPESTD
jgi:hypothetical protein